MDQAFRDAMTAGYALSEPGLVIGSPMHDGEVFNDARVAGRPVHPEPARPDRRRHRDGQDQDAPAARRTTLQAGRARLRRRHQGRPDRPRRPGRSDQPEAPGTGHLARAGTSRRPATRSSSCRCRASWAPRSGRPSTRSARCCMGKVLGLNDTQTSILALIFKYCDDNSLPLLDLKDLVATLKFLSSDEGKPILADYGGMSSASRRACSCARSSCWSRRAPTSSSASRSSR